MKLLVFQHIDCEHPGRLRTHLRANQIPWDVVKLDQGQAIPDLEDYDALWVMGGPMDVWDVQECPWLIAEKAAIRRWVNELRRPYLGLCLGHQLLADALGGTCGPQRPAEIGVLDIHLTAEGRSDPVFAGMPTTQKCLQWHSVAVLRPPQNAVVLASSEQCRIQAMRVGECAWSMQYHVELESDTIDNWAEIPAYRQALDNSLGADGLPTMKRHANANMRDFNDHAGLLYDNFMAAIEA